MPHRTYIDTCVLIAAYQGTEAASDNAIAIIADKNRTFIVSDILAMECVGPAIRNGFQEQAEYCQEFISRWEHVPVGDAVTKWALEVFSKHNIQPMDLLHIAVAVNANAEEFVTVEPTTKPFFKIDAPIVLRSLSQKAQNRRTQKSLVINEASF